MTIVAFSGSLRKDSFNTKLLRAMQKLAPEGMTIEIADISGFPLYNQESDASYPEAVQAVKDKVKAADGIIIATPEYNRSVSGVLKNAIDFLSRPYGTNPFAGKPALICGVSIGKVGTAVAQAHLRDICAFLDMQLIGQPELYLGPASELFDDAGDLTQDSTKQLVSKALGVLAERVK